MTVVFSRDFIKQTSYAAAAFLKGQHRGEIGEYGYHNGGGDKFTKFSQTHTPYHVFRAEKELFRRHGSAMARILADTQNVTVVGQADSLFDKEWQAIKHLVNLRALRTIEISEHFNDISAVGIAKRRHELPQGGVHTSYLTANFMKIADQDLKEINPTGQPTTVMCTGSLISNLKDPGNKKYPEEETKHYLAGLARLTGGNGHIVIGFDTTSDHGKLQAAYDSPLLADYYHNCLYFTLSVAEGIDLIDQNGNKLEITPELPEKLVRFQTSNFFDAREERNFRHQVVFKEPVTAMIDIGRDFSIVRIPAGRTDTVMNCYKLDGNRLIDMADYLTPRLKEFSIRFNTSYHNDGMMVQIYDVCPK